MQANNQNQSVTGVKDDVQEVCEWFRGESKIRLRTNYINGKKEGIQQENYINGKIKVRINYENDQKQGLYQEWYEAGNLKCSVQYVNGKKQGLYEEWYENSQDYIESIRNYIYEKKEEWYEKCAQLDSDDSGSSFNYCVEDYLDDNIQLRVNYVDDMKQGSEETFYKNNSIKQRVNYIDNIRQGLFQMFDKNGKLYLKVNYVNNLKQGLKEIFYPNGSIKYRVNFINGCRQGLFEEFYTVHKHTTKEIVNDVVIQKSMKFYVDNIQVTECAICLDQLDNPMITECGHIYCLSCFSKVSMILGNPSKCPLCYQISYFDF